MESQPQNPDFRISPENFHPCVLNLITILCTDPFHNSILSILKTV